MDLTHYIAGPYCTKLLSTLGTDVIKIERLDLGDGVRWPSPTLGQHNRDVYGELLGLPGAEIDHLEQTGIIGTKTTGSRII